VATADEVVALASGRPLLVAAQGDVANVIYESHTGFVADPADATSIAEAIRAACALGREGLREMGSKAHDYYARNFSADHGVRCIETLLAQAAATRRHTS
jgi:colanic acid biosynthesis glycosyl transferase WcaI